jgi:hypothetical protein
MALLQKAGRWLAARTQGTKGTQKYDSWMQRNPGFRNVLGAGDLALAFYGPGLIGKGLQGVGSAMGAGSRIGQAATSAGNFLAGTPAVSYRGPGTVGRGATKGIYGRIGQSLMGSATQPGPLPQIGKALGAAGRYAMANPEVTGAVIQAVPALASQNAAAQQMREANALALEEAKRRAAQREEIMNLLRPMFIRLQSGG